MRILRVVATIILLSALIFCLYQFVIAPIFLAPKVRIAHMIDPDSYLILQDGKIRRLQLIGVDAPEAAGPKRDIHQCYAEQAQKEAFNSLIKGQKYVQITSDSALGETDIHGRILRYVTLSDGRILNEELLKAGFAKEFHPEGKDYSRVDQFTKAQEEAKNSSKGFWRAENCEGKF